MITGNGDPLDPGKTLHEHCGQSKPACKASKKKLVAMNMAAGHGGSACTLLLILGVHVV